jgi:D-amino-acid oxidase
MAGIERLDCVVIGAGVVGLAVARALARAGRTVTVLEAGPRIGEGVSARSSEVIHAGLYYPPGSLKARLCVRGRKQLYAYCAARGIDHRRCGKLIVVPDESGFPALAALQARARQNGVDDLERLDRGALAAREPALAGAGALFSPSSGILDSHALMLCLQADVEAAGGLVVLSSPVRAGRVAGEGVMLELGGRDPLTLACRLVVNCAGLSAPALARAISGVPPALVPEAHYAKGQYFALAGKAPFRHLVYPLPEPGGLGIHLTLDLAGRARFGPDVTWVERPDYTVDPTCAGAFDDAIRRYWPGLPEGALTPDYAGVRPKIVGPGAPPGDFLILSGRDHGAPGLVHLMGIESPGLTACLAIGDHVADDAAN